jgi:hypothetical protein
LATYTQTISDLGSMDCVTDPLGFKATLESARTQRDLVAKDAAAIRSYLTDTIKPTLQEIRTSLDAADATTEGSH